MGKYDKSIALWNDIFSQEAPVFPQSRTSGNAAFDRGLQWLTEGAEAVLDFGCGNGSLLLLCSLYGTATHIGIDLSPAAIHSASARAKNAPRGTFRFICGSLDALRGLETASVDAVVLSNIIDNLYPEDAAAVLAEIRRVLRKNGRILLKLNPCLTAAQITSWNIRVIDGNLLDDGMVLWNQTTEEWDAFLGARFCIAHFEEIYYEEHEQYNRMYLLINE